MILLLADGKPCVTRSVLPVKDQEVNYLQVDSPSFSSSLSSLLKREDLELAVIECHINEKTCLPLINTIKKQRTDVPVLFITSSETDHAIADAFKRGARDCFRNPFDLKAFREQIAKIRSFKRSPREQRLPLTVSGSEDSMDRQLLSTLPDGIIRVMQFLEDHLSSQDMSLERLASIAGMSRYHFCRIFKQTIGHTPMQYVLYLRIERAKRLLRHHSKSMSVSQIAYTVGFYDSSNLNRHFKRHTGLTPTEYIHASDTSC